MTDHRDCQFDAHMMDVAFAMARRGLGTTSPNPSVGAVIADEKSGELVSRGWTQPGGRPHAETQALDAAGERAKTKTLYVTLEPCSHHGQTPPCVNAIIEAGIARVVIARTDPDPRVAGRGIARLKQAGLQVTTRAPTSQALEINLGHVLRVTERRPFVQLKLALDRNGQIAHGSGTKPTWVTGPLARSFGHMMRASTDAILIGRKTLVADNPELTCRLPGLFHASPTRVVLSDPKHLSKESKLLSSLAQCPNAPPVWVVSGSNQRPASSKNQSATKDTIERSPVHSDAQEPPGVQFIEVPFVSDTIWLPALAEALVERGITRLLVEGGPTLWRAFAKAGLVDEVVAFIANAPIDAKAGAKKRPPTTKKEAIDLLQKTLPSLKLSHQGTRTLGDDQMFTFKVS